MGRQFVKLFLDGLGSCIRVVATDVYTSTCLRYLAAHVFVETADDDVPLTVLHEVIRTRYRNRAAFGLTDTDYQHLDPFLFGAFGYRYGIVLVVLTIGDDDDRTACVALLAKTADGRTQRRADGGTLRLDELWFDGVEEHFCRDVVAGDRQLYERITGKDDESHFVVHHIVH